VEKQIGANYHERSSMQDIIFYCFAALTLICGLFVVVNPLSRNPVTSAMFLVLTILSMAGLFVLLHAFFLAAVQIVVYAGAVIVLFLFVIMLLDLKEEQRRRIKGFGLVVGAASVGGILFILFKSLLATRPQLTAQLSQPNLDGATAPLGTLLFTRYLLPFEIVSILLLVAMVGVILLSKKDQK
jgi:NADH-quinone oxidoreductase subunit J